MTFSHNGPLNFVYYIYRYIFLRKYYTQVFSHSPRGILFLFSLHHVSKAGISEGLGKVSVWGHEAVMVEAGSDAGRAEPEGLALGPTRVR